MIPLKSLTNTWSKLKEYFGTAVHVRQDIYTSLTCTWVRKKQRGETWTKCSLCLNRMPWRQVVYHFLWQFLQQSLRAEMTKPNSRCLALSLAIVNVRTRYLQSWLSLFHNLQNCGEIKKFSSSSQRTFYSKPPDETRLSYTILWLHQNLALLHHPVNFS